MLNGIYLLSFKNTPKLYVGQSYDIEKRFKNHIKELKNRTHTKKLLEAYDMYGLPILEIQEILPIDEDKDTKENYYIELWDSVDDGFNTLYTAAGGSAIGEDNVASKYSNEEYASIMNFIIANPTMTLVAVSKELDVSYSVVKQLANGRAHKWLKEEYTEEYTTMLSLSGTRNNKGENQGSSTSTNKQIEEALLLQYSNFKLTHKEIGDLLGLSEGVVSSICSGIGYTWLKDKYPIEYSQVMSNKSIKRSYSRSAAARGIQYPDIQSPLGDIFTVENVNAFAKLHGLDTGSLNKVLNRKAISTKGWKLL